MTSARVGAVPVALGLVALLACGNQSESKPPAKEPTSSDLGDGRILVAYRVLTDAWRSLAIHWERTGPRQMTLSEESLPIIYSTVLEVVDEQSGASSYRTIIDGYGQLVDNGGFARFQVTPEGIYQIELLSIRVPESR